MSGPAPAVDHDYIILEWWNGTKWIFVKKFFHEQTAWASLGLDNKGYRTRTLTGKILTTK